MSPRISYLDVLAGHAEQTPKALALQDPSSTLTWRELWLAVGVTSRWLRDEGVRPGDRVGIALPVGAPNLIMIFAAMAAGAVAAPVNISFTANEMRDYLARIDPAVVVAGPDQAGTVQAAGSARLVVLDPGPYDGDPLWPVGSGEPGCADLSGRDPLAPCLMFGTGGTTGLPKAAVWSDQALWLYGASCSIAMEVRRNDVELFFSPMFHIALVTGPFGTLFCGGALRLLPRFDADAVAQLLAQGQVTRFFGAPTALSRLITSPGFDAARMSQVRRVLFGSTRSEPDLPARLAQAFPAAEFITGYGATEFGAVIRLRSWENTDGVDHGVGRPVPGVTALIVGPDGTVLPDGETGELVIRAPWQMLGYWGLDSEADAAAAFVLGGVRSGDLALRADNGDIHLRGRSKDIVITGGENVFPGEVEDAVSSHPAVSEAAVFGVTDREWGERVVVAVVLAPGAAQPSAEELARHARKRLAAYKVPKQWHVLDVLPLTAASKVDKRALRERFADA